MSDHAHKKEPVVRERGSRVRRESLLELFLSPIAESIEWFGLGLAVITFFGVRLAWPGWGLQGAALVAIAVAAVSFAAAALYEWILSKLFR